MILLLDLKFRAIFAYIGVMRQILAVAFALTLGVPPVQAQEPNEELRDGLSLLQEGTRLLLEGLLKELGPTFLELQGRIIDLNAYYAPECSPMATSSSAAKYRLCRTRRLRARRIYEVSRSKCLIQN